MLIAPKKLSTVSIASKLSWASDRSTTRIEDQAYSLLGILKIKMQILYGDGEQAFTRLQQKIMKDLPDTSLFAWGSLVGGEYLSSSLGLEERHSDTISCCVHHHSVTSYLFAPSPTEFDSPGLRNVTFQKTSRSISVSQSGCH